MPRPVTPPDREQIAEAELAAHDSVRERFRAMGGEGGGYADSGAYWSALLNSPPFAAAIAQMGSLVRNAGERPGTYSHADREFVDMVLSFDWDYRGLLGIHIPDAVALGVRIEAIEALRAGREEQLTDDERLLADYIRRVLNGTVTDAAYEQMEARLGKRGTVEYTFFISFLQFVGRLWQAFGVPDIPDIGELLQSLRDGVMPEDVQARL
jgi:hypothetical protein